MGMLYRVWISGAWYRCVSIGNPRSFARSIAAFAELGDWQPCADVLNVRLGSILGMRRELDASRPTNWPLQHELVKLARQRMVEAYIVPSFWRIG